MPPSILITYATKYGSTRQVADTIAATLGESGLSVVVEPAASVHDLSSYDAVVLGTALYMGRPHADARRFLKRHHGALAGLPVAVFAMGPLKTGDDDIEGAKKQHAGAGEGLGCVAGLDGHLRRGRRSRGVGFPFNHMEASDARDWGGIEAWAREIGTLLSRQLSVAV